MPLTTSAETVSISGKLTARDLSRLSKKKGAKIASIEETDLDDFSLFNELKGLQDLRIYNSKIKDWTSLSSFPKLSSVFINNVRLTDTSVEVLGRLKSLEEIDLNLVSTLRRLPDFSRCKALRKIGVFKCKLLSCIAGAIKAPNLEEFSAFQTALSPEDLEPLMRQKTLRFIEAGFGKKTLDQKFLEMAKEHGLR